MVINNIRYYFLLFVIVIFSPPLYATPAVYRSNDAQRNIISQNVEQLLQEHGLLLNQAIVAASNDALPPEIEANKQKLLNNANQLALIFASVYGEQVGKQFEMLFIQHISLGSKYINAIKTNNEIIANQVANEAKSNGRMLAQFMSNLMPSIPYMSWQKMFDEHVMIEAQQTVAYFQKDIEQAVHLKNQSLVGLQELAAMIADGIQQQQAFQK